MFQNLRSCPLLFQCVPSRPFMLLIHRTRHRVQKHRSLGSHRGLTGNMASDEARNDKDNDNDKFHQCPENDSDSQRSCRRAEGCVEAGDEGVDDSDAKEGEDGCNCIEQLLAQVSQVFGRLIGISFVLLLHRLSLALVSTRLT